MKRREFLRAGAQAAVLGPLRAGPPWRRKIVSLSPTGGTTCDPPCHRRPADAPAVLAAYTADDHRRRLTNIGFCRRAIHKAMCIAPDHRLPAGPVRLQLRRVPRLKPYEPGDWDEQELDRLRDDGIGLIQLHDEWHDSLRLFGGNRFTACNPAGFRRFIDMVHRRGMKHHRLRFQRLLPAHRPRFPPPVGHPARFGGSLLAKRPLLAGESRLAGLLFCPIWCGSSTTTASTGCTTTWATFSRAARRPLRTRFSLSKKRRSTTAPWPTWRPDLRRGETPRGNRQGALRRRQAAADRLEDLRLSLGRRRGRERRPAARSRQGLSPVRGSLPGHEPGED